MGINEYKKLIVFSLSFAFSENILCEMFYSMFRKHEHWTIFRDSLCAKPAKGLQNTSCAYCVFAFHSWEEVFIYYKEKIRQIASYILESVARGEKRAKDHVKKPAQLKISKCMVFISLRNLSFLLTMAFYVCHFCFYSL